LPFCSYCCSAAAAIPSLILFSQYEDSFEDESSHSRKGEHSLDGISVSRRLLALTGSPFEAAVTRASQVSDHSIDNSHGDSYDMVEAAANDAGAALF
jgi:hypothetical protein